MQRLVRSVVLVLTFASLPLLGLAQDVKKKDKKGTPTPAAAPKFDEAPIRSKVLAGQFVQGKLTAAKVDEESEEKTLTVAYIHQIKKLNTDVQKKAQGVLIQAGRTKDKNQLNKLAEEYKALVAALYNIEEKPVVFQCSVEKDAAVRTMTLPMPLGDDGKPIKISAEEERKLKGDGKHPGYAATLKDLDPGEQLVRIYIDKTKIKPGTPAKKGEDEGAEEKMLYPVTLIVILPPADPTKVNPGAVNPFTGGK